MGALLRYSSVAVVTLVVARLVERRNHWLTLAFAAACVYTGALAFMAGVWPVGVIQIVWYLVAMRRWIDQLGDS